METDNEQGNQFNKTNQIDPINQANPNSPDFNEDNQSVKNYLSKYCDSLGNGDNNLIGISSGFKLLDKKIQGLRDLIFLEGQPKIGKTNFLINLVINLVEKENLVVYFSFDINKRAIITRIFTRLSRTPYYEILKRGKDIFSKKYGGNLSDLEMAEKVKLEEAKDFLLDKGEILYLIDSADLGFKSDNFREVDLFNSIKSKLETIKANKSNKKAVFIFDYLEVMPFFKKFKSINQKRIELLRQLKSLQKEFKDCFLIVSQKYGNQSQSQSQAQAKDSDDLVYEYEKISIPDIILELDKEEDGLDREKRLSGISLDTKLLLKYKGKDIKEGEIYYLKNNDNFKFEEVN